MSLARAREQLRKGDTRHKIELGGLVIKAGLGDEDRAVILGALLDAARAIKSLNGSDKRERFSMVGKQAFLLEE